MRILPNLTDKVRGALNRAYIDSGAKKGKIIHLFIPSYPGPKVKTMECALNMLYGFNELGTGIRTALKLVGGAYIDVMRNAALVEMLEDPKAIGVLMVDHDAIWVNRNHSIVNGKHDDGFNALYRLMARDKDIIGALTTTRAMPIRLMCGAYTDEGGLAMLNDITKGHPSNGNPFQVEWTACHFTYISRRAALKIASHYGSDKHFFECASRIMVDVEKRTKVEELMDQFRAGKFDRDEALEKILLWVDMAGVWQEDVSFCRRARAAGCEIWIDPSFEVQHIGDYAYSRADWLGQKQREMEAERQQELQAAKGA